MCLDSKIVESFALGADKLRYLITYDVAPHFYGFLKDNVDNSDCYTVLFVESSYKYLLEGFNSSVSDLDLSKII